MAPLKNVRPQVAFFQVASLIVMWYRLQAALPQSGGVRALLCL